MASTYLPQENHVVRYVPFSKQIVKDDIVVGILGEAFRLRPAEEYLSATWAEFHGKDSLDENIVAAIHSIRNSDLKPTTKSAFAIGEVNKIDVICKEKGRKIRFIHEPEPDNDAHTALRQWPNDDIELFERLATHEWSEFRLNKDIP